ncbi:MAG: hypothetical protein UW63_C0021G0009 [Candidatus Uhrbacteria bacterium GW2011_GWF2_44_350]|uniref:Uncharacterized protein n=1 Tax=Candidatus Uhrbacteria bacterium GW2011_GWF2_44_350 TaxID=1619000 RepID=A0A0G1MFW0_9BACT|nr:MAG: hypothetical protein UW63_C0021G0009 [Candidatus Uhrbacteria bacterium GW2011_GWF2_44_350]HBR80635.1 hypothetical protein [Candidatus Uhrbacteria bacterium]HCU31564.1 hypothetical protein [Candidatus Uhrbacteria bacterium]
MKYKFLAFLLLIFLPIVFLGLTCGNFYQASQAFPALADWISQHPYQALLSLGGVLTLTIFTIILPPVSSSEDLGHAPDNSKRFGSGNF